MPVSKTIVFMTDGIIDTGDTLYSAYGMERWDKRVTGGWTSDADQTGRHDARFKMMCETTKGMGVSIWVVAFASTLTSSLSGCATNTNQALVATTAAELKTRFEKIGNEIGALRLTQ
jgi:Flp pilus assembly pilin Flp